MRRLTLCLLSCQSLKKINEFGFDEKYLDKAAAEEIIAETNEAWNKLKSGETEAGKLWTGE